MQSRLLIINCPSEYFVYIPMGTFGLCDYLGQKNIQTRLLNLSLYDKGEMEKVLDHYLSLFRPTHIGLILHWQETAEGVIRVSEYIKSRLDVKIVCGGFTAGYFGRNLLEKCRFVDYVIKGDPEKPLELLLKGTELSEIPNLIYRDHTGILSNEVSYFIDHDTISRISFSKVTYLYDHKLYMEAVEKKLGFPIFIGRGCIFNCQYCGGSCGAFRLHSGRLRPVVRSINSVITDLKLLKDFTRKIYICYENDRDYIKALFKAIKKEKTLIKTFQLNYGAWKLFDKDFLELYKDIFSFDKGSKPIFEISPEVFDDKARERIKNQNVAYSIKDLKENLYLIKDYMGDNLNVSLFFSRYHNTTKKYSDIKKEIVEIFRLKHELFCNNIVNAKVCYDHLSTDVASHYWENYVENPRDLNTLISATRRLKIQEHYSFPVDNLCIYIPKTLSGDEVFRCELLIFILKTLENHFNELFHIMFKCLGEQSIDLIEEIIKEVYSNRSENIFKSMDYCVLINYVKLKITQNESLKRKLPFIEDLAGLNIKKATCKRKAEPSGNLSQTRRPGLNHEFISVNAHDYLDLPNFLKRLEKEGPNNLVPQKTVFIFLVDEIMSMSYETYRKTLKVFEKDFSLDEYYGMMKREHIFNLSYHKDLVEKLFQSSVLY